MDLISTDFGIHNADYLVALLVLTEPRGHDDNGGDVKYAIGNGVPDEVEGLQKPGISQMVKATIVLSERTAVNYSRQVLWNRTSNKADLGVQTETCWLMGRPLVCVQVTGLSDSNQCPAWHVCWHGVRLFLGLTPG